MMKNKLTDYQIENLIENVVKKEKNLKLEKVKKHYIKKLKECKTKKQSFAVLNELFYLRYAQLNENQYGIVLTEASLADIIKSGLGGGWSTFKEHVYRMILGKVNEMFGGKLPAGLIDGMAVGLTNIDVTENWRKFLSPIKNCEFFAEAALEGVVEHYLKGLVDDTLGSSEIRQFFGDSLRNSVFSALSSLKEVDSFERKITEPICAAIRKAFSAGGDIGSMFKGKGVGDVLGGLKGAFAPGE